MTENQNIPQRHNFRKLNVWVEAVDLAVSIFKVTKKFPDFEKYGITSQITRSAVSVPSNIAEGCSRKSNKHFVTFLEIALGSAFELETQLIISNKVGYLTHSDYEQLLMENHEIQKKLHNFIEKLEKG
jgi:four helix bundle protein